MTPVDSTLTRYLVRKFEQGLGIKNHTILWNKGENNQILGSAKIRVFFVKVKRIPNCAHRLILISFLPTIFLCCCVAKVFWLGFESTPIFLSHFLCYFDERNDCISLVVIEKIIKTIILHGIFSRIQSHGFFIFDISLFPRKKWWKNPWNHGYLWILPLSCICFLFILKS